MKKVKIGFLPLYVKLYDDGSPEIRPRINAFSEEIANKLQIDGETEVISADVCRLENEFEDAFALFKKEEVDCVVTLHLAYSPSLQSEKILKNTDLPIIILDTTPTFDYTDNAENTLMYNHGIHGVQDMCNLLVRNNKRFFIEAGHYEKSDVVARVIKRAKGILAAKTFSSAKVGRIGGEFDGMGDFLLDDGVFETLGIERLELSQYEAKSYMQKVTDEEIDVLIEEDQGKYIVQELKEDFYRNSIRGDLAVRKWIEDNNLTAFTANFMNIKSDFGLSGMPFAEANRAMERGIGYAGEGDFLTAALVGAFMSVSNETSFVEMFCPDWKNNMIFISHMGEMNTALAAEKPKYMKKEMQFSDIDTTWTCGTYKSGTATLVDIAPLGGSNFRIITSLVEMQVPECANFKNDTTCGWFSPNSDISDFLENYSKLGGTHHLSLMYGDMRKTAETFAELKKFDYIEI